MTPTHPAQTPLPPDAPRVLLVDDNRELRSGMSRYLGIFGFAVTEASDGKSALDALDAGPPFRFLLTDLSLPDVDGREVAQKARRVSPETWNAVITGWDVDVDELRPWGVDRVFQKPIELSFLCKLLAEGPLAGADPPPG